MDDEAGAVNGSIGGVGGQLADNAAEVLPVGQGVVADAVVVDTAVILALEHRPHLVVAGGRLFEDVEIPQQTLGVDNLRYAEDDVRSVVVAPRGGEEGLPRDAALGGGMVVGVEEVVEGP